MASLTHDHALHFTEAGLKPNPDPSFADQDKKDQGYPDAIPPRAANDSPASVTSSSGNPGKPQIVFIHKLFDMLKDQSLSHLIWWSPSQDSFCLYPGEEFSNVLAQYFKHTNIASFIRQLNMYGFHKVNDNFQSDDKTEPLLQPSKWEFRHSANQFRKGDIESLSLIKRKSSKASNSHKEIVNIKSLPPTSDAQMDTKPDLHAQDLYQSPVPQQPWNQFNGPAGAKPDKDSRQMYPSTIMAHHPYPVYSHIPHSPGSPPFPDQVGSSSYLLHIPQLQQPSQPGLRQASVQTPVLPVDLSFNLKLIEMNAAINSLKSNYQDLLARYDTLFLMHQRGQTDLLQLTEIVEKLAAKVNPDGSDKARARTPIDRRATPGQDGMSPNTIKQSGKGGLDLLSFKSQLSRRVSNPTTGPAATKAQGNQNYHLTNQPLTKVPTAIVPQHYPLNPNYTLYNNQDGRLRQMSLSSDDHLHQPSVRQPPRHVSILMDPLQPVAGRLGTSAPIKDEPGPEKDDKQYAQPYQPVPPQTYYQHVMKEHTQARTTSLPTTLRPIPTRLPESIPQRHSLVTLHSPSFENDSQTSVTLHDVQGQERKQEDQLPAPPVRNQLPSMEELNKSIAGSSPGPNSRVFGVSESEEAAKRRKLRD